jgi:hypothetical protein
MRYANGMLERPSCVSRTMNPCALRWATVSLSPCAPPLSVEVFEAEWKVGECQLVRQTLAQFVARGEAHRGSR